MFSIWQLIPARLPLPVSPMPSTTLKASSDEQLSADWALSVLRANADTRVQERVERLILANKRMTPRPQTGDQQLLVDIDLSILGANPERFAEYDRQVRCRGTAGCQISSIK